MCIRDRLRDEEGDVELGVARRHIIFRTGSYRIVSRLLEGEFLDYRAAIPEGGATTVKIGTRDLISAIDRASLLISDNIKSPLRMKFEEGLIKISCSTAIGKAYDEIRCEQSEMCIRDRMNSAPSFGTFLVTIIPLICSKYSPGPDKWQAIFTQFIQPCDSARNSHIIFFAIDRASSHLLRTCMNTFIVLSQGL